MRHALAIACWVAGWFCAGFIVAAWFAARAGKRDVARMEFATGVLGAAGLACIGAVLW